MNQSNCKNENFHPLQYNDGNVTVSDTFYGNVALWRYHLGKELGFDDATMEGVLTDLQRGVELSQQGITTLNTMLSALKAMAPKDPMELRLMLQMLQTHGIAAELLGKSHNTSSLSFEEYSKASIRFMRLYLQQMEALRRYRNGGKQEITVNHIQASQAIVGDVYANRG